LPRETAEPAPERSRREGAIRAWIDALLFGSAWVALAAAALVAASSQAMGLPPAPPVMGLAFCGTLVVYSVDRLRDLDRDALTAPLRSAFVVRHRRGLEVQAATALGVAGVCAWQAGPAVVSVAAGVALFGFFHRRLKGSLLAKPLYLTLSWTAVGVALPAVHGSNARHALWVAAIVALVVQSNVVLSNLRDREGVAHRLGTRRALWIAAGLLVPALALALIGPASVQPLVWLPLSMVPAVACYRPSERYGAGIVDGALLVGALAALLHAGLAAG
jgi:hypothetical protein